jgi:hypothetical protein
LTDRSFLVNFTVTAVVNCGLLQRRPIKPHSFCTQTLLPPVRRCFAVINFAGEEV